MPFAVRADRRDREADAGVHERRRDLIDVAAKETRCVAERRGAEAVEVQIVLAKAFVEHAKAAADGGLPITGDIPGDTDAWRHVCGRIAGAWRQAARTLLGHAIVGGAAAPDH